MSMMKSSKDRNTAFESCNLTLLEKLLELETGYRIEGHELELYGLCPQCRLSAA